MPLLSAAPAAASHADGAGSNGTASDRAGDAAAAKQADAGALPSTAASDPKAAQLLEELRKLGVPRDQLATVDASTCQRYLAARGGNVARAAALLKSTLAWRQEFNVGEGCAGQPLCQWNWPIQTKRTLTDCYLPAPQPR
jgi:hypothetical protein